MRFARRASFLLESTTASMIALAPFAQQGHELFRSNGGENVSVLNSPSVGGSTGTPDFAGDLFYKGLPEFATVHASGLVHLVSIEDLFVATVDWPGAAATGGPVLYDLGISRTSAGSPGDPLVPDIFNGASLTALLSFGASGLPHPCTIAPTTTCTGSAACPPPIQGYTVDIDLASPIALPANATDTSGSAALWFLPGGMTYSTSSGAGACGLGDYVFVGAQSVDEHQASVTNVPGASWTEGFQIGDPTGFSPTGPIPELASRLTEFSFGFAELVVEPVFEDSAAVGGYAPERGAASLAVSPASGSLRLGVRIVGDASLAGGLALTAASPIILQAPFDVLGAPLLLAPTGYFQGSLAAWAGTPPLAPVDSNGDGLFEQAETETPRIAVPSGVTGNMYLQSFVLPPTGPVQSSTVWRVRFP